MIFGAGAIRRFNVAADPLPYLDCLLGDPQSAAVVDGGGVPIQVRELARVVAPP